MKRLSFFQNKLWRDRAVEMMEKTGSIIHWSYLEDEKYIDELKTKLLEEANETCLAQTPEEIKFECADLLEVIECLCDARQISMEEVFAAKAKKQLERGSFKERKFVTIAEHLEGSFGASYCLADPAKYPEI